MTKKELINALLDWPDNTQIEVGVPCNLHSDNPIKEDKIWLSIDMVEPANDSIKDNNKLCLLFCTQITME